MIDFVYITIWVVLSSLITQIDNVPGVLDQAGIVGTEDYEPIVNIIKIGIGVFSILLFGLSVSAYKKTALKNIIYACVAFGLFAAQLFFDYLEDVVISLSQPYNDVIFYAMTLAILILFFLAIVRRNRPT